MTNSSLTLAQNYYLQNGARLVKIIVLQGD